MIRKTSIFISHRIDRTFVYLPSSFPSKVDIIQVGEYIRESHGSGVLDAVFVVFFEAGSSGNRGAFQVWRTDSGGRSNDQNNGQIVG